MAKRGVLYTTEELQYRKLAKQANQRAVRLERYLQDHPDAPTRGLDLYNYYLHQDFGSDKKRFQENPKKLSAEQISVYTVQLSNFLNYDVSRVKAVKQYETAYKEYLKNKEKQLKHYEGKKTVTLPPLTPEQFDKYMTNRITGIENKVLPEGDKITSPSAFFDAINAMHKQGIDKVMGYRSAMRIAAGLQNVSIKKVKNEISKIAGEMAEKKPIAYRDILERFEKLQPKK